MLSYIILISFLVFFGIVMFLVIAHSSAKIKQQPNKLSGIIITKQQTPTIHEPSPRPNKEEIWFCNYCGHENSIHKEKCKNCKANRFKH